MQWSNDAKVNALVDNPCFGELHDRDEIEEYERWLEQDRLADRLDAMHRDWLKEHGSVA